VLRCMLGVEIDQDDIPIQDVGTYDPETVVEAQTVRTIDGVQVESD
jgi:hypothetical protein